LNLRVSVVTLGVTKKLFGVYIMLQAHGMPLIQSTKEQIITMSHTVVANLHSKQDQGLKIINLESLLRLRVTA